jgi:hypothetical protein
MTLTVGDETLLVVKNVLVFAYFDSEKMLYFNQTYDDICVVPTKTTYLLEFNTTLPKGRVRRYPTLPFPHRGGSGSCIIF